MEDEIKNITRGVVTVLENQIGAETTAQDTHSVTKDTNRRCCSMGGYIKLMALALCTIGIGFAVGGTYVYVKGPNFLGLGLVPESYGRKSYNELMKTTAAHSSSMRAMESELEQLRQQHQNLIEQKEELGRLRAAWSSRNK